jgi:Ca2+-binding EF-hand superfamily protein
MLEPSSPTRPDKRYRLSVALRKKNSSKEGNAMSDITLYERQEIKALFEMLDEDGSGDIDEGELRRAFDMLGWTSEKVSMH